MHGKFKQATPHETGLAQHAIRVPGSVQDRVIGSGEVEAIPEHSRKYGVQTCDSHFGEFGRRPQTMIATSTRLILGSGLREVADELVRFSSSRSSWGLSCNQNHG